MLRYEEGVTEMRSNMKAERVRCGYTIREAAKKLGVHPNTVSSWENETAEPLASNIVAMAKLYGCTPDYLLGASVDRSNQAVCV